MESLVEEKVFPESVVKELREENASLRTENRDAKSHVLTKGYLPTSRLNSYNSNLGFHINKFPLGGPENFSVTRAIYARSVENGRMSGRAWDVYAPWEKAYIEAYSQIQAKAQGDQISGQDGGFLAPEYWSSSWHDLLRSYTVLDQLQITRVSVPLRVARLPKVTSDVTVSYGGENIAPSAVQYKLGQSTYNARKAIAEISISNELIKDAGELADQIFRQSTANAIAIDRDTKLLTGQNKQVTGSLPTADTRPVGLIDMAIMGTINEYYPGASATTDLATSAAHAIPSFLHLSSLRTKIDTLNGSANVTTGQARCTGMIAHSRLLKTIHTLSAAAGPWTDAQGRPLWMAGLNGGIGNNSAPTQGAGEGTGSLLGLPWMLTNLLPTLSTDGGGTVSSYVIGGFWERYVLYECLTPTFDFTALAGDANRGFALDETICKATYRYDGGPAQPEAFAVLAGCDLAAA